MSASEPARIFISYRRSDAGWPARWLADQMAGQFGAGLVFQDVDAIQPGDDFAAQIEAAVGACSVLLAVIGPRWLAAEGDAGRRLDDPQDWVRLEIEAALARGVRVIPVLVDGARMPSASELPLPLRDLARRQAVMLSPATLDTRRLFSVMRAALPQEREQAQTGTRRPEPSRASRLLMGVIKEASALTGEAKARALAQAIPAAAVAVPERAGWLAAAAETAARSIEDARSRWPVLTAVAGAVATADSQHAEAIARSIDDASSRSRALAAVAAAVAAGDPEHAEAIAGSIEDVYWRSRGLAAIARTLATGDPERAVRLAVEAETAARSIEEMEALAVAGAAVAAAEPERAAWLSIEAESGARSIKDALSRWSTLAAIAGAAAAGDPVRAEAVARSIEDVSWRSQALASVAVVVAADDPEHAETLARSIEDTDWQSIALAEISAVVVVADPEHAEALAHSIQDASQRSYALVDLARLLAQHDRLNPT